MNKHLISDPRNDIPEFEIRYEVKAAIIRFKVYELFGWGGIDGDSIPGFQYVNPESACPMVDALDEPPEEAPWASGTLKFDGCLDLVFDEQDRGNALHFCDCGPENVMARIFAAIYALGPQLDCWTG